MLITREWLDSISDGRGLTKGQQYLLNRWVGGVPYVGKLLDDKIAVFLEKCKGYRPNKSEFSIGVNDDFSESIR